MFMVTVLLLIVLSTGVGGQDDHGPCKQKVLNPRPHSVSILEFGAVGDGKTLNTVAFQNAVFYAKSFADKGGAQLFVPSGKWLTGSFNLTSHLTLFLERGATIIASQGGKFVHSVFGSILYFQSNLCCACKANVIQILTSRVFLCVYLIALLRKTQKEKQNKIFNTILLTLFNLVILPVFWSIKSVHEVIFLQPADGNCQYTMFTGMPILLTPENFTHAFCFVSFQDYAHWPAVDPLPSYGRGIDVPGGRYSSLIYGRNLSDVVITGDNGIIDGQGSVWWDLIRTHSLNHSRPHIIELVNSDDIVISNLTLLNSPASSIHPVYCSNVRIQNITAHAPPEFPYTSGIVPDSSEHVCIDNSNISTGHDAIVLKSGWDQYGVAYGKPTSNVHIKGVYLQSSSGAGLAFGSEMSGGISGITAEHLYIINSTIGIELKTTRGRGGYMRNISISSTTLENIYLGISMTGFSGSHPDDKYDPNAVPVVGNVTFENVIGANVAIAGNFSGIVDSPFTPIFLSNVVFSTGSESFSPWFCSNVNGVSEEVFPEPCPDLQNTLSNFSSIFSSLHPSYSYVSSA